MKYRLTKFTLIHLLLLYFILLSEKMYFTAKIFSMHIISMGLTRVDAETYLEPSRTSMVVLLYGNHKKVLLQMLDSVLNNTSLVQVLQQKRLKEITIYLKQSKWTSKICYCVLVSPINKMHFGLTKKVQFVLRFFVAADMLNTFTLKTKTQ